MSEEHAAQSEIKPSFTDRQARAWQETVSPILERHLISTDWRGYYWDVRWSGGPKRGWHFNATHCDGEHFAQVLMDTYGYPTVSIAELDWVHADSDEEMECETCAPPPEAQS